MDVALVLSKRSTCVKAAVGCVLTDARGRILATGYNGVAHGQDHCNEPCGDIPNPKLEGRKAEHWEIARVAVYPHACPGHDLPPGSESCQAVHAEVNALMQCRDVDAIDTVYCTAEPCFRCTKELLNTGARRIVWEKVYGPEPQAGALWQKAGREWQQISGKNA